MHEKNHRDTEKWKLEGTRRLSLGSWSGKIWNNIDSFFKGPKLMVIIYKLALFELSQFHSIKSVRKRTNYLVEACLKNWLLHIGILGFEFGSKLYLLYLCTEIRSLAIQSWRCRKEFACSLIQEWVYKPLYFSVLSIWQNNLYIPLFSST